MFIYIYIQICVCISMEYLYPEASKLAPPNTNFTVRPWYIDTRCSRERSLDSVFFSMDKEDE